MRYASQNHANVKGQFLGSLASADVALPVFGRLLETLQEENALISAKRSVDYRQFALRKSQGLLELSRLGPTLAGVAATSPKVVASLTALLEILELNKKMLGVQVKAAQKVSEVIATAIQEGQSDGTYSPLSWRYQEE